MSDLPKKSSRGKMFNFFGDLKFFQLKLFSLTHLTGKKFHWGFCPADYCHHSRSLVVSGATDPILTNFKERLLKYVFLFELNILEEQAI